MPEPEPTFMAHPLTDAEMQAARDAYLRPAGPVSRAEFAAMIEIAMHDMWDDTVPWGASQFSWFRKPRRRLNLFRARSAASSRLERSAWQEAGRSAWIEGVRERLQSAVYAASNGYGWTWTAPGVFGVPGQPAWLQVRDATQPWRPSGREVPDA